MKIADPQVRAPVPSTKPPLLDKRDVDMHTDASGLLAIGKAFGDYGNAEERANAEQSRAWSSTALSSARLQWTEEFIKRQSTAAPGAPDFTPNLLEDFDKYHTKAKENAPNEQSRMFLDERLHDLRADLGSKAAVYEAQARIDWRKDQFKQSADNLAKLMNKDPGQYKTVLAEQLAILDASDMPQVAKSAAREEMITRVSGAAVWSQIQRSPAAFLQSIGFYGEGDVPAGKTRRSSGDLTGTTGNTAFDILPFEKRAEAFKQAIALKSQLDTDAAKQAEANRKILAGNASKDLWDKHFSNTLRLEDIQSMKQVLDENDYKALREAQSRGPVRRDDPGTLSTLTRLMYGPDPMAAMRFADTAYRTGLLADDTYRTESARAHSLARGEGLKTEFERSRQWIAQTLNPGELIHDPVGHQRLGDALRTFDDWMLAAPGGKPRQDKEIRERATEVLEQYQFLRLNDTVLALPMPRGTRISRSTDKEVLKADIAAAHRKLEEQRNNGGLNQQEFQNEMNTLARWKRAMEGHQ